MGNPQAALDVGECGIYILRVHAREPLVAIEVPGALPPERRTFQFDADPAARRDYWGGGLATQALVFAIAWGTEEEADLVETIATEMFAPISQSHRITVEQMALLEPALSETLINGCIEVITQGLQKVIDLGVPEAAAKDFCMGHLQISIALLFEELNWKLSDGALMALKNAQGSLFRDDWDAIFKPENVLASVKQITGGDK